MSTIPNTAPAEDRVLTAITEWYGKDQLCAAWYAIGAAHAALAAGDAGEAKQILDHLMALQEDRHVSQRARIAGVPASGEAR